MSKSESKKWINAVGRLLLAYALIVTQSALAGQNQKTKAAADSAQKAAAQQTGDKQSSAATNAKAHAEEVQGEPSETLVAQEGTARDASHQGIKVHGHWTIEVRSPDGTVVTHREFENAYVAGNNILPNILHRDAVVGGWSIGLSGSACGNTACSIAEAASGIPADSKDLVVSLLFPSPIQLVLSGTLPAASSGAIGGVNTQVGQCGPTVSLAACLASVPDANNNFAQTLFVFTSAGVAISVSAGQTIAVTVRISFS